MGSNTTGMLIAFGGITAFLSIAYIIYSRQKSEMRSNDSESETTPVYEKYDENDDIWEEKEANDRDYKPDYQGASTKLYYGGSKRRKRSYKKSRKGNSKKNRKSKKRGKK